MYYIFQVENILVLKTLAALDPGAIQLQSQPIELKFLFAAEMNVTQSSRIQYSNYDNQPYRRARIALLETGQVPRFTVKAKILNNS